MSNDPIPTHDQISALAALVRAGTPSPASNEQAAVLLGMIGSALRIAIQAGERHPDDPVAADASVAGAWQPVATEYGRLLRALEAQSPGGSRVSAGARVKR